MPLPVMITIVKQWVRGWRGGVTNSCLHTLDEKTGRQMVKTSTML